MWFKTLIVWCGLVVSAHACFVDVSKDTHGWVSGTPNVASKNEDIHFLNLERKHVHVGHHKVIVESKDEYFIFIFNDQKTTQRFFEFMRTEQVKCD